ncbi:hypothetical protein C5167_031286 [Papaver somniferum]|nr:hypothetical protein C5167_031286 [Papaver somniferum]
MFPTDLSFFAFVNKVLQDRNSAIKIDSIKVVYNGGSASFPDQVSNWLHAASEAEAAEIIISSRQERDCVVPVQVFSNPRLKYLDLDLHCRISIPTPDQLDLPEVTHVKIRNTNFDQPDLGLDLTSNSPKLEYLDFGHIQTRGDGINITVISQSLRDLKVKIRYGVGDLYRPSMMNVHAPAMSSLVSYCVDKLVLQDVSALQSADVAVIKPNLPVAKHNLQFLQQMVGVKDMRISFFPTSQGAPAGLVFLNLQNLHLSLCNMTASPISPHLFAVLPMSSFSGSNSVYFFIPSNDNKQDHSLNCGREDEVKTVGKFRKRDISS